MNFLLCSNSKRETELIQHLCTAISEMLKKKILPSPHNEYIKANSDNVHAADMLSCVNCISCSVLQYSSIRVAPFWVFTNRYLASPAILTGCLGHTPDMLAFLPGLFLQEQIPFFSCKLTKYCLRSGSFVPHAGDTKLVDKKMRTSVAQKNIYAGTWENCMNDDL